MQHTLLCSQGCSASLSSPITIGYYLANTVTVMKQYCDVLLVELCTAFYTSYLAN